MIGREGVRKEPGKELSHTRSGHDRCRLDRMLTSTCPKPVRHAVDVTGACNITLGFNKSRSPTAMKNRMGFFELLGMMVS
jgi:hypothetical protein